MVDWAYGPLVDPAVDEAFMKATGGNGSAVVAQCAKEGQVVCKKAIDIFNECYGSEVLVSLSHPGDVALVIL